MTRPFPFVAVCLSLVAFFALAHRVPGGATPAVPSPGTAVKPVSPRANGTALASAGDEMTTRVSRETGRWLLLTPPVRKLGYRDFAVLTEKPLLEWTVQKTFEREEECVRTRKVIIGQIAKQRQEQPPLSQPDGGTPSDNFTTGLRSPVTLTMFAKSRCVHSEVLEKSTSDPSK